MNPDKPKVSYVTCPIEKRLSLLFTFLKRNRQKKTVVIFNSIASAKFHSDLFQHFELETTFINSKEKQSKIDNVNSGIIFLCKDFVKIPNSDWCVLYEPVCDVKEFLSGKLLIILQPYEINFLNYLSSVETEELKFTWSKVTDVQLQVEKLISENYFLNISAKEAFKHFLREYNSLDLKDVFNIKNIELKKLCLSFGFKIPVAVDLTEEDKEISERRLKRKRKEGHIKSEYRRMEDLKKKKIYKLVKSKK